MAILGGSKFSISIALYLLSVSICYGRPSDLDFFYSRWRPLDLVRGLRSMSIDPLNVFRSLEAVKDLDSDEALDLMHGLDIRPITIYDALDDLDIDPFDAYYALKSWLIDPSLHSLDENFPKVNATGDTAQVNDALKEMEREYRESFREDRFKMKDFIKRAKRLHSAFDDPQKVFRDFFGKRHFNEWKELFPEAFKGLKTIYRNPLGDSYKKNDAANATSYRHHDAYKHVQRGRNYDNDKGISWFRRPFSFSNIDNYDKQFNDTGRYQTLQDETHMEEEGNPNQQGGKNVQKIHHVKRYFDKHRNMYVECRKTEECEQTAHGIVRRVKSHVRHVSPTDNPNDAPEQDQLNQQQQQQPPQQQQQQPPQQQQQQQPPQQQQQQPHQQQQQPQQQQPPQQQPPQQQSPQQQQQQQPQQQQPPQQQPPQQQPQQHQPPQQQQQPQQQQPQQHQPPQQQQHPQQQQPPQHNPPPPF